MKVETREHHLDFSFKQKNAKIAISSERRKARKLLLLLYLRLLFPGGPFQSLNKNRYISK